MLGKSLAARGLIIHRERLQRELKNLSGVHRALLKARSGSVGHFAWHSGLAPLFFRIQWCRPGVGCVPAHTEPWGTSSTKKRRATLWSAQTFHGGPC